MPFIFPGVRLSILPDPENTDPVKYKGQSQKGGAQFQEEALHQVILGIESSQVAAGDRD